MLSATGGVPAVVAGDELPLAAEPGARPLLALLRCALQPGALDEDAAAELLTGPLGGTDAVGLRRLRRSLHAADIGAGLPPGNQPLASALRDPRQLNLLGGPRGRRGAAGGHAARAGPAHRPGRDHAGRGPRPTAYDVLWAIWDASGLGPGVAGGERGRGSPRRGGRPGSGRRGRPVRRGVPVRGPAAARLTLAVPGQHGRPGDPRRHPGRPRPARARRSRILTAHRSKGLEWDLVVVAGVQEGHLARPADALLAAGHGRAGRRGGRARPGRGPPGASDAAAAALVSKLLDEERRLFYVAVTRARRALVVTAAGGEDSEDRPSRFLAELAGDDVEIEQVASAGRHWLSLPALTAELRRAAADPGRPRAVRAAAAAQLARLAAAGVRGAHPRQWYALTTLSDPGPLTGGIIQLSPSQVESFTKCGLRWLLEAAAGAGTSDVLRHLGTVIHAAAVLAAEGAGEAGIEERIDDIWHHLDFGSAWYNDKQRELARRMVARFLAWHRGNPRQLVAVEQALRVRIGQVEITGRVDRLERDEHGGGVIVDLKTGSSRPPDGDLDRNPQLGVYQLALLLGAFEQFGLVEPGGAELVQVGKAGLKAEVKVQRQRALGEDPEPGWAARLVETVAAGMTGPVFGATVNPGCRVCPVRTCCPVHPDGAQVTP